MSRDKLDSIGYIDDKLIEKADQYISVKKESNWIKNNWIKYVAVAACLCLVIGISVPKLLAGNSKGEEAINEGGQESIASDDVKPFDSALVLWEGKAVSGPLAQKLKESKDTDTIEILARAIVDDSFLYEEKTLEELYEATQTATDANKEEATIAYKAAFKAYYEDVAKSLGLKTPYEVKGDSLNFGICFNMTVNEFKEFNSDKIAYYFCVDEKYVDSNTPDLITVPSK